jgi:hypothetical protein
VKEKILQWAGQESMKLLFVGLAGLIGWIWSFIATVPMVQQVRADVVKIVEERDGTLARNVDMVDNKLDRVILYLCIKEKIRDGRICN